MTRPQYYIHQDQETGVAFKKTLHFSHLYTTLLKETTAMVGEGKDLLVVSRAEWGFILLVRNLKAWGCRIFPSPWLS